MKRKELKLEVKNSELLGQEVNQSFIKLLKQANQLGLKGETLLEIEKIKFHDSILFVFVCRDQWIDRLKIFVYKWIGKLG